MAEKAKTGTADIATVQPGHRLSYTSYYEVLKVEGLNIAVKDEAGNGLYLEQRGGNIGPEETLVNRQMHSADTFTSTVKCSRSEAIDKMLSAGDAVMTVFFHKQVDPKKAFDQVKTGNKLKSHAEQQKDFEAAIKGEDRVLKGYILSTENNLGRTLFKDLEKGEPRLVDHRSVYCLILKGVQYIVA